MQQAVSQVSTGFEQSTQCMAQSINDRQRGGRVTQVNMTSWTINTAESWVSCKACSSNAGFFKASNTFHSKYHRIAAIGQFHNQPLFQSTNATQRAQSASVYACTSKESDANIKVSERCLWQACPKR